VVISHVGRRATVLRRRRAVDFLAEVELGGGQELRARLTGNYRRGNERIPPASTQQPALNERFHPHSVA